MKLNISKTELRQTGFAIIGLGIIMISLALIEYPNPFQILGATLIGMGLVIMSTELGKHQLPGSKQ